MRSPRFPASLGVAIWVSFLSFSVSFPFFASDVAYAEPDGDSSHAQRSSAQPGSVPPASTQPGSTQPGSTQTGSTQPGSAQPAAAPSGSARPSAPQSSPENAPFWPGVVDTIDVTALSPSLRERLAEGVPFATFVPLGAAAPSSRELGDLLTRIAGVHVHRYGSSGSFTTASIRASGPQQLQVLLDGFPVGGASAGIPNLSLLPIANLEYAEIFRGARSSLVPGPASAGTIALHTPATLQTPLRVAIGAGSFGTYAARGQWGGQVGPWGLLLSGQQRESEGDFEYLNRNGTVRNPEDDAVASRKNNAFRESSWLIKSNLRPADALRLDFTSQHQNDRRGIPGTETVQTEHVHTSRTTESDQWGIHFNPRWPGKAASFGRPVLEGRFRTGETVEQFENLRGEVGLRRVDEKNRTEREAKSLSLELPVVPVKARLGLLAADETEEWTPRDELRQVTGFTRSRRSSSYVLTHQQGWSRFLVDWSYRWDHARDNFAGPVVFGQDPVSSETRHHRFEGASYGGRWNVFPVLAIKGNRSHFSRYPTFSELFGQAGWQDGNPALLPEKGLQWDAGLSITPSKRGHLELVYFESVTEDKIVWLQNSQRTIKAHNLGRSWSRGIESSLFASFPLPARIALGIELAHTWQEALDLGASRTYHGKRLPNLPESEFYGRFDLDRGPWEIVYGLSTRGRSYRDRYNTAEKRLAGFATHDLEVAHTFLQGHATVRLEVRNWSDVRIQDIDGFPLPGRTLFFELETRG